MYGGQGNYNPQFRQGLPGPPPPPYQQPLPGPPPFMQAPPGPSLPSALHGPLVTPLGQQPSPFFSRLATPLAQQPVHFPLPPPTNSSQFSQQLPLPPAPPPPPLQVNGSAPLVPPYPSAGFSAPVQISNSNAHFGIQLPPPPRILPPPPQPISQPQGQVLYHNPHPPNPGMLHAPPHPPWPSTGPILHPPHPPPSFDLKIPSPFIGKPSARDVHPPSIPPSPSPPPPPPPPPPSSPPPLPPSPPAPIPTSESFPMDSLEVFTPNSKIDSRKFDDAQVHLGDASKCLIVGNKFPMVDGEALENRALSPPRPDESVVRNMEVLCQFIVKVGPDFENTAREKEAGNPKFDFLFGGKPGSAAAIGHEYFQWMKKKYFAERKPSKGVKQNALSISTLTADISSQSGNVECLDGAHSPATSDMDMEDDIGPADIGKAFSNKNKESSVSANARSYAFENEKLQFRDETHLANGASFPVTSIDAEDDKELSVFEDVSPDRGSPDSVGLGDRTHASMLISRDSIIAKASPNNENAKSQVALGVYLKYGSPFRLIQDYASDESDNENVRSGNDTISNPVSLPATTVVTSSLQQKKQSEPCSNFGGQDVSTAGNESEYCITTSQFSPSKLQGAVRSPDQTVLSTINFDTIYKDLVPDVHQVEKTLNDRSETSRPPSEYGVPERRKMDRDQESEKFYSKENLTEKNDSHNVDEFGRLVKKGGSGSDSDGSRYIERQAKRGRSRSPSLSRSPQGSRWRRRSRSPRKRDRRSHSRSWSPKKGRSRSPQSFRSNISARRGRNLPPDCFNFMRGRCFYGASCRFLHRDSGRMNMQQRYQDSRKPRYLDRFDDLPFSRISHHDKPGVTELHAAKRNKLAEADNIITQTIFNKFSDVKDGPIPSPEAEDASNLGSQGMTHEAEDTNNLVSREMTPEAEDTNNLLFREITPEAEDTNNPVFREMTPEAEDTNNPVFREMAPEAEDTNNPVFREMTPEAEDTNNQASQEVTPDAEDASNLVSLEMTPEAEDTNNLASQEVTPDAEDASNLASLEMIPEADDGSSPVSSKIIRSELEPPFEENPFTSVDGGTAQPMLEASEPLLADSFSVQSPARKSMSSPHHTVFEQHSSGDVVSSQLFPSNTLASTSYAEKSSQQALLVRTSQSSTVPVQASTSQINVGKDVASEEAANQIITAHSYSQDVSSVEPSVQLLQEEFSPHNLLMSESNFSPPPPLSLPPPPHGNHARPFIPPPPPQHMQHSMHIPSDSSNSLFSSQQFREDIVLPMTSFQSQLPPPPYMLYPQRPPLPKNLLSNQPNLPWSDQHMLPLLRPPFPSSETSQLHHLHNSNPPRIDFMPLARPYPPSEVLGSRPSDFYSQAFLSVPSVHPPRHQPFPNEQGGVHLHNQGLPLLRSVQGDRLDLRSYPGDEFSASHLREINQPLYNQQNSANFGSPGMMHPSMQRYTESNFQLQPADVGASRFPIKEHYNPYASTFEQPLRSGPGLPGPQIKRYDSSLSADNAPIIGIGFEMRSSPRSSMRLGEQVLPRTGNYIHESSAERTSDVKKQLVQEPVAGAQYDPLFDSIEPSPDASKIRIEEQNSGVNDTGSASKLRATKVGSKKNKGGSVNEPKAETDELGEVATDADAGGVENESPQLLDDKNWSPLLPFDVGETNVGEIEINQARSPGKSKKIRDSRSMKVFKTAIADFAKEVLKPSWRQGNLSKEAFKTIVKKTVDKVAGAVPSYQVPKSQAKINQYMESSQRKLTKLVLGYVDKYVKM